VDDDVVKVFETAALTEAEVARGLLEAAGIPVMEKGGAESEAYPGPAYLFVPASRADEARRVLNEAKAGTFELPAEDEA
jgi:hypothetical protein